MSSRFALMSCKQARHLDDGAVENVEEELRRDADGEHQQRHGNDDEIAAIIDAIRQLMAPLEKPRREIGFHVHENAPRYRTRIRR